MSVGHRNTVIDGWRGLSVSMVIIGHFVGYRLNLSAPVAALDRLGLPFGTKALAIVSSLGGLGVGFFFVISGYLITSLLVAEEQKTASVSLKAFYIRRVCRIMPAFYVYVASVYALGQFGLVQLSDEAIVRSSTYLCNFSGFSCSWWLAHTWSLAAEEQFYLAWPLLFMLGHRVAVASVAFAVLLVGSVFIPELSSFTFIAVGVLVALRSQTKAMLANIKPSVALAVLAALVVLPALPLPFLSPLKPFLVAIVFFGTLFGPHSRLREIIGTPALAKIGLVSYSLYLWQQLSLAPIEWGGQITGTTVLRQFEPVAALLFIPLALASYHFVEQPMVRLGRKLSRRCQTRDSLAAQFS